MGVIGSGGTAKSLRRIERWMESRGESIALVLRHQGQLLLRIGPCDRPVPVNSVRKSLLGALYGIAVRNGDIDVNITLGDADFDEAPGLTGHEKTARLWDLLCSRSGIFLPAPPQPAQPDYPSLRSRPQHHHWLHEPRPARGKFQPGAKWFYNNWDFNVAGLLFEQLTGKSVFLAFERLIARPTRMRHFDPFSHGRYLYRRDYLGATPRAPYYQFSLSADDQATFGQLYLDHGLFECSSIIPSDWVEQTTRPISKTGLTGMFSHYGCMWWVEASSGRPAAFTAFGARGHFIGVLPDIRVVIVLQCVAPEAAQYVTEDDYEELVTLIRHALTT
ncbi:serine hydrolase domain-containing protein [Candidimonas nitroreducens]|uniref:Amide hydrolase n=1 Tax=Candidimonas nitroreducens TaxID=683354 RepID=A0A225MRQ4_9BURK|nr:serine hydrolase [Candidimonas nitroreducens]OWT63956.1 amide hydrolase [Candidimonas nitroreducens]